MRRHRLLLKDRAPSCSLICLQDIFTLFHVDRPFKFVSKTSNFFIPIVGWSMFLTGTLIFQRPGLTSLDCMQITVSGPSYTCQFPCHFRQGHGQLCR